MKDISILPLDLQRKLIDYCISENSDTIFFDGEHYCLPHILQITYFCEECSNSYPMKIFKADIILQRFATSLDCPNCNSIFQQNRSDKVKIYIYNKSAVNVQTVIRKSNRKTEKGLLQYMKDDDDDNAT